MMRKESGWGGENWDRPASVSALDFGGASPSPPHPTLPPTRLQHVAKLVHKDKQQRKKHCGWLKSVKHPSAHGLIRKPPPSSFLFKKKNQEGRKKKKKREREREREVYHDVSASR
jgi:hypothetical protein